jgi:hypothetical protein
MSRPIDFLDYRFLELQNQISNLLRNQLENTEGTIVSEDALFSNIITSAAAHEQAQLSLDVSSEGTWRVRKKGAENTQTALSGGLMEILYEYAQISDPEFQKLLQSHDLKLASAPNIQDRGAMGLILDECIAESDQYLLENKDRLLQHLIQTMEILKNQLAMGLIVMAS